MGKSQRDKGARAEREIVTLLRAHEIPAERVPLSGAAAYRGEGHDVTINGRLRAEVKIRKDDFQRLYGWVEGNDVLFVRRDRDDWLVVMPLDTWIREMKR